MAAERSEATIVRHRACVTRGMAIDVEAGIGRQQFAQASHQQHFAPHQQGRADVVDHRARGGGKADAERVGAECWLASSRRQDVWFGAGSVDRKQPGTGDLLHVIGVTAAVVTVVDTDHGYAARFGLGDRYLRTAIGGNVPTLLPPSISAETGVSRTMRIGVRGLPVFSSSAMARMRGRLAKRYPHSALSINWSTMIAASSVG